MRDPQLINADEDTRMIPLWSMAMAAAVFVLVEYYFWLVFPQTQHHVPPAGASHLSESLLGIGSRALFSDGGICKQGCAATRDEFPVLDADLLRDAGRHRRGSLLSASRAPGFEVPGVRDACAKRFSFLPAVRLPAQASCGNCFRTVRATDQFCTRCGHELSHDAMPARLRVMAEIG